ncbi:MAG: tRNA (N6-isopentenyl adenosine(37)-C2)-methylthiotransferase MiaB [Patescibacteria group bacterium]
MKYKIIAFGCQFNIADAEKVAAVLEMVGYQKAENEKEADLIMVLACSVRQTAIDRIYGLKKRFEKIKKSRPLITVLSGCVLESDKVKMAKFFDLVIDIKDLARLQKKLTKLKVLVSSKQAVNYFEIHPSYNSKFIAYVPVMNGCNNFCSYCVVPYTRGREVSRSAKLIIKQCEELIVNGYKEIVLLGQNVNSYSDGKTNFPKLLKTIDQIPGNYWLSFATSHPKDMSDELIKVMALSQHVIPYLHLPVQSGDNEILRKMNRHYTVSHYQSLIKKVRQLMPNITLSTDVIVGFPGETKNQFLKTLSLFKKLKFDMAYIAQYSPRLGTVAAKMADNVSLKEKKRRQLVLTKILGQTAFEHNKSLVGKNMPVLVDGYKDGFCFGRTKNFKNIKFTSAVDLTGQLVLVKITDFYAWGLVGQLPKVVVILGPTSSGKTKLAVKLAKKFNGEIISADSRQVYRGMDIGTGKDLAEYGLVPYHLIDVASPKEQFTLAQWQKLALEKINNVLERGKLPIICGGTGLYISALVSGYQLSAASYKLSPIRKRLNKLTLKQLLLKLKKVDPKTFKIIDKNNRRRVQRALEIYYETGQPKSARQANRIPPYNFLIIGLNVSKDILYRQIEKRLKQRLEKEGMINEVKRLHQQGGVSWQKLQDFGLEYRFTSRYLLKKITYQQMFDQLNQAIRDFSKRQMTWFRQQLRTSEFLAEKGLKVIWLNNHKAIVSQIKIFLGR